MKNLFLSIFMLIGFSGFAQEYDFALGTWEGTMSKKKLTIVIEEVKKDIVKGYNILGTNKRAIKGKIVSIDRGGECGGNGYYCIATLKEPGDDKWDGVFVLNFSFCPEIGEDGEPLNPNEKVSICSGTWKANNGKLSGDFMLNRK